MQVTNTSQRERTGREGSALLATIVLFMVLFGIVLMNVTTSSLEVRASRVALDEIRVNQVAESAFERGMHHLERTVALNPFDPLQGLDNLFAGGATITPFAGERIFEDGAIVGGYAVTMTRDEITDTSITITLQTTGYLPDAPANLAPGQELDSWKALEVTVRYEQQASTVFDYSYFINNWGWFYGNTIHANGNVRSNGQFDVGGYGPWANGQPLYDSLTYSGGTASLSGYHDDNGDGLEDGNDGGVWSGWDIVNAWNLNGTGGNASNQHDFTEATEMPNLTDLTRFEDRATTAGSSIEIAGSPVSDAVYGDGAGELSNLYLVGTAADPIVLDGPIVVRGDVIISGYVTGQGAIYAGGNVYVPDSIEYVDGPTTTRPTGTTQAETESWLTNNADKDFLGLFAKENIVVGDHTNGTWRHYVSGWMASSLNSSREDAGEDGIPNTSVGRDGVAGTADDDVLEGDGLFSIEYYTAEHDALGQIPSGASIGDPIPGTGEDIDGDGAYDDTTSLADIDFTVPLDAANWGGNMPAGGIANYSDVASLYANNLDAVFYTNHSFCYLVLGSDPAQLNGAVVSRNENIVYGTPHIEMNHDSRLLGGGGGLDFGLLPDVMPPAQILRWSDLDEDPNHMIGVMP